MAQLGLTDAPIIVLPGFGLYPSLGENLPIGAVLTGISVLRSDALRRLCARGQHG